jgi:hypothetical protein
LKDVDDMIRNREQTTPQRPLTAEEVREVYRMLEPLAGLYIQLTPLIAQMTGDDEDDTRVWLPEVLAAWEAARKRGPRRSGAA